MTGPGRASIATAAVVMLPFPALPSGSWAWSSLTLATDSLEDAHEYSGHAKLHVGVSLGALTDCRA